MDMVSPHLFQFKVRNLGYQAEEIELQSNSPDFELTNLQIIKIPPGLEHVAFIRFDPFVNTNYCGMITCKTKDGNLELPIECKRKPLKIRYDDILVLGVIPVSQSIPFRVSFHNSEKTSVYLFLQAHPALNIDNCAFCIPPNSDFIFESCLLVKSHGHFNETLNFVEERLGTVHEIRVSASAIILDIELSSSHVSFPIIDSQKSSQQSIWIKNNSDFICSYNLVFVTKLSPPYISTISKTVLVKKLGVLQRPWDSDLSKTSNSKQLMLQQFDNIVYPHSFAKIEATFSPRRSGLFNAVYHLNCTGCEFPFLINLNAEAQGPCGSLDIADEYSFVVGLSHKLPCTIVNKSDLLGLSYELIISTQYDCKLTCSCSGYLNTSEKTKLSIDIFSNVPGSCLISFRCKFEGTDQVVQKNVKCRFELPEYTIKAVSKITDTFAVPISINIGLPSIHGDVSILIAQNNSDIKYKDGVLEILSVCDPSVTLIAMSKWGELSRKEIEFDVLKSKTHFYKNAISNTCCILDIQTIQIDVVSDNTDYVSKELLKIQNVVGNIQIVHEFTDILVNKTAIQYLTVKALTTGLYSFEIVNLSNEILAIDGIFENPKIDLKCAFENLSTITPQSFQITGECRYDLECTLEFWLDSKLIEKCEFLTNQSMVVWHKFNENKQYQIQLKIMWHGSIIGEMSLHTAVLNEPVEIFGDLDFHSMPNHLEIKKELTMINRGLVVRDLILKGNDENVLISKKRIQLLPNEPFIVVVQLNKVKRYDAMVDVIIKSKIFAKIPVLGVVASPKIIIHSSLKLYLAPGKINTATFSISNPFDYPLQIHFEHPKVMKIAKSVNLEAREQIEMELQIANKGDSKLAINFVKLSCAFKHSKLKQFINFENTCVPVVPRISDVVFLQNGLTMLSIKHPSNLRILNEGLPRYFNDTVFIKDLHEIVVKDELGYVTQLEIPTKQQVQFKLPMIQKEICFPKMAFDFAFEECQSRQLVILPFKDEKCFFKIIRYKNKTHIHCRILEPDPFIKGYLHLLINGLLHVVQYKIVMKPLVLEINSTIHEYYDEASVVTNCMGDIKNRSFFGITFKIGDSEVENEFTSIGSFKIGKKEFIHVDDKSNATSKME